MYTIYVYMLQRRTHPLPLDMVMVATPQGQLATPERSDSDAELPLPSREELEVASKTSRGLWNRAQRAYAQETRVLRQL